MLSFTRFCLGCIFLVSSSGAFADSGGSSPQAAVLATSPPVSACNYDPRYERIYPVNDASGKATPECVASIKCNGGPYDVSVCDPQPSNQLCPDAVTCAQSGKEFGPDFTPTNALAVLCLQKLTGDAAVTTTGSNCQQKGKPGASPASGLVNTQATPVGQFH